jgi:hypothetical protein
MQIVGMIYGYALVSTGAQDLTSPGFTRDDTVEVKHRKLQALLAPGTRDASLPL